MAQFPCLPLWTDAWIADTHYMTITARGAYMDLLILMWRTPGCRVPDDDAWLAQQLHLTAAELRDILRPVIARHCQSDGNHITQKRLKREFRNAFERSGRLSALHKRRKNNGSPPYGSSSTADDDQEQSRNPKPNLNTNNLSSSGEVQQPEKAEPRPFRALTSPSPELAEINQRMGWSPAGTRKPSP